MIDQFGDADARHTADIAADNWYDSNVFGGSPRRRRVSGLRKLPTPGNLLNLGAALEVEYVLPSGELRGFKYPLSSGVGLLWSDRLQACLLFPNARVGACNRPPTAREKDLLAIWARGRVARCSMEARYNLPPMPVAYPCVQVSYRSDKFSEGTPKNYIHHMDSRGVKVYCSSEPFGAARSPQAIMIRGGNLRLTSHGLAG